MQSLGAAVFFHELEYLADLLADVILSALTKVHGIANVAILIHKVGNRHEKLSAVW